MTSILIGFLLTVHVIVCVLLILIVLMQRPKSEGLGTTFGGGVTDTLFGSGAGTFALIWPRAHARNLFGGEPVLAGSQAFAAFVLAALAVTGVLVATARETR